MPRIDRSLDPFTRASHLGMALFAVLAWSVSDWADDYKTIHHYGYTLHGWLGLGGGLFLSLRLVWGLVGPKKIRFGSWFPLTRERLLPAWEDLRGLLTFRLPERPPHAGLAGVVEAIGLVAMLLLVITGGTLFWGVVPGQKMGALLHDVKEIHELGGGLLATFLCLHAGAVVLHALAGDHIWRQMLFRKSDTE